MGEERNLYHGRILCSSVGASRYDYCEPSWLTFSDTSALETFCAGQFTLSTQLIKPNYLVMPPPPPLSSSTQHHSFFRNLPNPFIYDDTKHYRSNILIRVLRAHQELVENTYYEIPQTFGLHHNRNGCGTS